MLDLGAGYGARAATLLKFFGCYVGVEMMEQFVLYYEQYVRPLLNKSCLGRKIGPLLLAPVEEVDAEGFHAIHLNHLMVHFGWFPAIDQLVRFKRMLRPGGVLLVKEPRCHQRECTQSYNGGVVIIRRSKDEWEALFFAAGLIVSLETTLRFSASKICKFSKAGAVQSGAAADRASISSVASA